MEQLICGVDLGGTKLAVGLFTQNGTLIIKETIHDHVDLPCDKLVAKIAHQIRTICEKVSFPISKLKGIGVAMAGHINCREGMVLTSSNFPLSMKNFPFVSHLKQYFPDVAISLDNDANAQALGEYLHGAGRNTQSMVFVTISTGIGSGIIVDGKILRGVNGTAGEIGHMIVDYDSDIPCTCGNYGCSMALSSGMFFPELYRKFLTQGLRSTLGITVKDTCKVDGKTIKKGLEIGDPISIAISAQSARIVGLSLYNLFQILNPELFVLGGGLTSLGESYLTDIKQEFYNHTHDMMMGTIEIKLAETGENAGILGAASLVMEKI